MARLLLAHPLFLATSEAETAASSPYFPLGLLYLAGYAREHGHEVAVFDGTFCPGPDAFAERLEAEPADLVGISALLPTRGDALTLAAMASASGAVVVLGGPDPTADPAPYLASDAVDVVVHHEGEQTIVRLLDLFDEGRLDRATLADEPGVAFRRQDDDNGHGEVVVTEPRPPIENLDELPLPARDLIDLDRYLQVWEEDNGYASVTIATSRGCPFGCDWCRDAVHGDGFRQRSAASVAAEVKALTEAYDITHLRVIDDVDGIERSWFEEWAAEATEVGAAVPFEPLNDSVRKDLPLLQVQDSL